jgi:hypothetical protein
MLGSLMQCLTWVAVSLAAFATLLGLTKWRSYKRIVISLSFVAGSAVMGLLYITPDQSPYGVWQSSPANFSTSQVPLYLTVRETAWVYGLVAAGLLALGWANFRDWRKQRFSKSI